MLKLGEEVSMGIAYTEITLKMRVIVSEFRMDTSPNRKPAQ
jgi:hypothetical protein